MLCTHESIHDTLSTYYIIEVSESKFITDVNLDAVSADQRNAVKNSRRTLPNFKVSDVLSEIKVLGVVADNSACGHYRVINPLHMLRAYGARADYSSDKGLAEFWNYDVIILPRQHNREVLEAARFAQWEGKIVIYEIDDDLHHVLPSSPAYFSYHPGAPELQQIPNFLAACHGFTTTTPEIARWYSQYNRNAAICENYIDFSFRDWNVDVQWDSGHPIFRPLAPRRYHGTDDKIVIGWQGGSTHQEDLLQIGKALYKALTTRSNTVLAMYCSVDAMMTLKNKFNLPEDKIIHIPARHFLDHPEGMHGIDIGLAPLVGCQFNLAKSHLKVLEGMAANTAMIASNVGPYSRFWARHPGSFDLVGKGHGCIKTWEEAILGLIDDPVRLREQKIQGRQLAINHYSLEKNVFVWPNAWRAISQRTANGQIGPPDVVHAPVKYETWGRVGDNETCPCGSGIEYWNCCKDAWG